MKDLTQVFSPNRTVSEGTVRIVAVLQVLLVLACWNYLTPPIIPKPMEVLEALGRLWGKGLGAELWVSLTMNLKAIAIAAGLALVLAYSTVMPAFRPLVEALSKLRFLGLSGLTFIFTMVASTNLKISVLVFGISAFMLTDFAGVVAAAPKDKFDLARTLRMGEWRVVWEVIVLGQIDKVFNVIRTSAAIGWVMLTMVESLVRADGGIGVMLVVQTKYQRLSDIFAIQFTILAVGLLQDYFLRLMKKLVCPYAELSLERK